jgi:hypothetical protein
MGNPNPRETIGFLIYLLGMSLLVIAMLCLAVNGCSLDTSKAPPVQFKPDPREVCTKKDLFKKIGAVFAVNKEWVMVAFYHGSGNERSHCVTKRTTALEKYL